MYKDTSMKKIYTYLPIALMLFLLSCGSPVKIVKFDTKPEAPFKGDSVWLFWEVENAVDVTLDGKSVAKDTGRTRVLLDESKTFILRALGSNSEATNKLNIVAQPK
jgi:hypothetical protein